MQKLKQAFASLTSSKPKVDPNKVKEETPESRYEAARDRFLEYNAQLEGESPPPRPSPSSPSPSHDMYGSV